MEEISTSELNWYVVLVVGMWYLDTQKMWLIGELKNAEDERCKCALITTSFISERYWTDVTSMLFLLRFYYPQLVIV